MKLDVKIASVDALDAVRAKPGRICPLICDHGFKADGDRCTKITCRAGYEVGDDNTCEKIEVKKPTAKREEPKRERPERAKTEAAPAKPQASPLTVGVGADQFLEVAELSSSALEAGHKSKFAIERACGDAYP